MKYTILLPALLLTGLMAGGAVSTSCTGKSGGPASAIGPINKTSYGAAIKGYDPVAYFINGKPIRGSRRFEYGWMGAKWYFESAEHKALFINNPEKYAPKYGGYCAYAVSVGTTADIDPEQWNIVEGRLYLNLSRKIRDKWSKDIPGNIKKADENWPNILKKMD